LFLAPTRWARHMSCSTVLIFRPFKSYISACSN
jgi:hypothetical protein